MQAYERIEKATDELDEIQYSHLFRIRRALAVDASKHQSIFRRSEDLQDMGISTTEDLHGEQVDEEYLYEEEGQAQRWPPCT